MAGPRGKFIALEGIDGCGKSTQAHLLAERCGAVLTREPGGTPLGGRIRSIVLDGDESGASIDPRAEALLMVADRAQHVAELIVPALESGRWVVTDRFAASTIAYQGYGRGLGAAELGRITAWASRELVPDLYVLVEVEPAVGRARRTGSSDRIESENDMFHLAVARGFAEQVSAEPSRWAVVDGDGSVEEVAALVHAAVVSRLGAP